MKPSRNMIIYGILAGLGLAIPWYYNIQFFATGGSLLQFLQIGFANPAASSISADISIACCTFLIWMFFESFRLRMRYWLIFIVLTFLVAFAFAFPLFLMIRERKLEEMNS